MLQDISSVLERQPDEMFLMEELFEEQSWRDDELLDDGDEPDAVVDGWNRFIVRQKGKIWWEEMYTEDIKLRVDQDDPVDPVVPIEPAVNEPVAEAPQHPHQQPEDVKEMMQSMMNKMEEGFKEMKEMIGAMDRRLKSVEDFKRDFENERNSRWENSPFREGKFLYLTSKNS